MVKKVMGSNDILGVGRKKEIKEGIIFKRK
jgi:hypothetical protein